MFGVSGLGSRAVQGWLSWFQDLGHIGLRI